MATVNGVPLEAGNERMNKRGEIKMNGEVKSYEIPWIPVAERLPTPAESSEKTLGLNILITVEDEQGNKEVSIGFYNHDDEEFKDLRAWYDIDLEINDGAIEEPFKVAAWAPLPTAYIKGEDE